MATKMYWVKDNGTHSMWISFVLLIFLEVFNYGTIFNTNLCFVNSACDKNYDTFIQSKKQCILLFIHVLKFFTKTAILIVLIQNVFKSTQMLSILNQIFSFFFRLVIHVVLKETIILHCWIVKSLFLVMSKSNLFACLRNTIDITKL